MPALFISTEITSFYSPYDFYEWTLKELMAGIRGMQNKINTNWIDWLLLTD